MPFYKLRNRQAVKLSACKKVSTELVVPLADRNGDTIEEETPVPRSDNNKTSYLELCCSHNLEQKGI